MKPRYGKWLPGLLVLGALVLVLAQDRDGDRLHAIQLSGATMGTTFHVTAVLPRDATAPETLRPAVEAVLERVNSLMSTWDPNSEVSRFNVDRGTDWFPVSAATLSVVQAAQVISRATTGAFDITVGPLVDLWGFGAASDYSKDAVPDPAAIAATRARIGHDLLELRASPPALRKRQPELEIDLSAIAKGYGVDRVAQVLDDHGIENYLVEIGGEMRMRGHNHRGQPWQVAVERPAPGQRSIHRVIGVTDAAVATSGDYRNFFELDGQRYSHAIDPRTGQPVPWVLGSVTVVAETCTRADGLATALMILGPDAAIDFAETHDVAVLLLVRSPDGFIERASTAFRDRYPAQ